VTMMAFQPYEISVRSPAALSVWAGLDGLRRVWCDQHHVRSPCVGIWFGIMNTPVLRAPDGMLRGPGFDFTFIVGLALMSLACGAAVTAEPGLFWPILALDLWLLGYHHLIATFTRLAFDRESFQEHRKLILLLPWAVAAGVAAITLLGGLWLLTSVYLYWQWFHYARQSEGISKAYAGRCANKDIGNARIARFAFYSVPVAGILHVSARAPAEFLMMPVRTVPVPSWLASAALVVAGIAVLTWGIYQLRAWRRKQLAGSYVAYVVSHFTVFATGYIVIEQINYGWLAVNMWHNAQYILFVWLFNNRRFQGAIDAKRVFLSTISQTGRFPLYIAVCLTLSTAIYFLLQRFGVGALGNALGVSAAVAAVMIYQTLNFHHYVVDALVWKLRKPALSSKLGLT
jgi:hypothetical protein